MRVHVLTTSECALRAGDLEPGMLVKLQFGWAQVVAENTIIGHTANVFVNAAALDMEPDQIVTVMSTKGDNNGNEVGEGHD